MKHLSLKLTLCLSLFLLAFTTGCEQEELMTEKDGPSLAADLGGGGKDVDIPCPPDVPMNVNWSVSASADQIYDLAIEISPGPDPSVADNCNIMECEVCITFSFGEFDIDGMGQIDPGNSENIIPILEDKDNGYYFPPLENKEQGAGQDQHTICMTMPLVATTYMIGFLNGLPPGITPNNAVTNITGLCMIDNIPDPNGGGGLIPVIIPDTAS